MTFSFLMHASHALDKTTIYFNKKKYQLSYEMYKTPTKVDINGNPEGRETPMQTLISYFRTIKNTSAQEFYKIDEYTCLFDGKANPKPDDIDKWKKAADFLLKGGVKIYGVIKFNEYTVYIKRYPTGPDIICGTPLKKIKDKYFIITDTGPDKKFMEELSSQNYDVKKMTDLYSKPPKNSENKTKKSSKNNQGRAYSIRVLYTRNPSAYVAFFKDKGFEAFLNPYKVKSGPVFVGKFKSIQDASEMMKKIQIMEKDGKKIFSHAYVVQYPGEFKRPTLTLEELITADTRRIKGFSKGKGYTLPDDVIRIKNDFKEIYPDIQILLVRRLMLDDRDYSGIVQKSIMDNSEIPELCRFVAACELAYAGKDTGKDLIVSNLKKKHDLSLIVQVYAWTSLTGIKDYQGLEKIDEIFNLQISELMKTTRRYPWDEDDVLRFILTRMNHFKGYEKTSEVVNSFVDSVHGFTEYMLHNPRVTHTGPPSGGSKQVSFEGLVRDTCTLIVDFKLSQHKKLIPEYAKLYKGKEYIEDFFKKLDL